MKKKKLIIITIVFLIIILGIILITFGVNINNKDSKKTYITKEQAEKILKKDLGQEAKDIKFIEEADEYYKFDVDSDNEEIKGNYLVDKSKKKVMKEYTGTTTSSYNVE